METVRLNGIGQEQERIHRSTPLRSSRPKDLRTKYSCHICQAVQQNRSNRSTAHPPIERQKQSTDGERPDAEEPLLVEIIGNKRQAICFKSAPPGRSIEPSGQEKDSVKQESLVSNALQSVQGFVLPRGYPNTVSSDYLEYQIRCLPAHITGWMSRSLVTSSLINALNIGASAQGTVAASAAIKWITKDGIGAFGRFLVGGRLAGVFDEDPRRWRMIAVAFATVGFGFEIATTAFPANFVLLAGAGNLTKAVGKGLSQPSFRIIQTHFASSNNVGDISAKEEVWEVAAQLLGLGASVLLLRAIEASGNPTSVLPIWAIIQVVHVSLRYYALKALTFQQLNQKRASLLVAAYFAKEPLPGLREANEREPILAGSNGVSPNIQFGASLKTVLGDQIDPDMEDLAQLYKSKGYWLVWKGGKGHALLAEDYKPIDILQALLQGTMLEAEGVVNAAKMDHLHSLEFAEKALPGLLEEMHSAGWDPEYNVYKVGDTRIAWSNR